MAHQEREAVTRRPSGKKLRQERFVVDGVTVLVDLRVTDDGQFSFEIDGTEYQRPTLRELREVVKPVLEQIHRMEWDLFIYVSYEEADSNSRWDNHRGDANREEVTISFSAGYASRKEAPGYGNFHACRRWAEAEVDDHTFEILPLGDKARRDADQLHFDESLIPFTAKRWRTLQAIAAGIAEIRARIASLLDDKEGKLLDELPVASRDRMLGALPDAAVQPSARKRSKR